MISIIFKGMQVVSAWIKPKTLTSRSEIERMTPDELADLPPWHEKSTGKR